MSLRKLFLGLSILVLVVIGGFGLFKNKKTTLPDAQKPIEVLAKRVEITLPPPKAIPKVETLETTPVVLASATEEKQFPSIDRIQQFFSTNGVRFPVVETITYTSRVAWLKGRPAWIADYASYYNTSRHFIARSLNGKPDYLNQKVSSGSRFNVFKKEKNIHFYLLVDLSRAKMAFYYVDLDTKERMLVKTYSVGVGRMDSSKASGFTTPTGTFALGSKIAVYQPGTMGYFMDEKKEMIQVFGTRWIPFGQEIENCSESPKGYGIHGAPWIVHSKTKELVENKECIGKHETDGSIRLLQEDMEELFSIIITKPAYVVIVKDFNDAKLPGVEVNL